MRRIAAWAAAVVLGAAGLVAASPPAPATAHGAEVFPGSRQYLCWVDGQTGNGQVDPQNPACANAYAVSGTSAFYNWFGSLDSNGAGRTAGYIPDGQICDGGGRGPYDFSGFNAVRDDWPRTHLTAGETYQFQHNNWAEHPGRFDVYVTEEGWDPSSPLAWDDLELIDSVTNPPDTGGPGALNYYYWDVTLPADRSGDHMIFTHWSARTATRTSTLAPTSRSTAATARSRGSATTAASRPSPRARTRRRAPRDPSWRCPSPPRARTSCGARPSPGASPGTTCSTPRPGR
ncbi:lytic polysaccharide monooxygenase [Cellulosimicrobium funkei]|uniref:lytic polysaccharide monooxygenase n=1 Tax=Cellulosimicrobium funkei TaxID=264251 RepID=UPI0030FB2755